MRLTHRALMFVATVPLSAMAQGQVPQTGMPHAHGGIMYHAPRWSPDGKWLVASADPDGNGDIYLVRADGGELRRLTRTTGAEDMARFSDDGRRILFQSEISGATTDLSMNLDGGDVRPTPRDSVVSRSPDGKTLLFESVRDGRGRLFTMSADRTNVREIANKRHAEQGSFSPDGRSIVFEQRKSMHEDIPTSDIVVARPDGSEPRVIATGTDPAWSRDGQVILFKAWDVASQSLWISTVSPTGQGLKRLATGVHMQWSPDEKRIAFMRDRADGGADIWIMNSDGSDAHCVTCRAPFR